MKNKTSPREQCVLCYLYTLIYLYPHVVGVLMHIHKQKLKRQCGTKIWNKLAANRTQALLGMYYTSFRIYSVLYKHCIPILYKYMAAGPRWVTSCSPNSLCLTWYQTRVTLMSSSAASPSTAATALLSSSYSYRTRNENVV
jgi:hypothetical protein